MPKIQKAPNHLVMLEKITEILSKMPFKSCVLEVEFGDATFTYEKNRPVKMGFHYEGEVDERD